MIINLKWFLIIVSVVGILRFMWWLWVDDTASMRETKDGDWASRWGYYGLREKNIVIWLVIAAAIIGAVVYNETPEQQRRHYIDVFNEIIGNQ